MHRAEPAFTCLLERTVLKPRALTQGVGSPAGSKSILRCLPAASQGVPTRQQTPQLPGIWFSSLWDTHRAQLHLVPGLGAGCAQAGPTRDKHGQPSCHQQHEGSGVLPPPRGACPTPAPSQRTPLDLEASPTPLLPEMPSAFKVKCAGLGGAGGPILTAAAPSSGCTLGPPVF